MTMLQCQLKIHIKTRLSIYSKDKVYHSHGAQSTYLHEALEPIAAYSTGVIYKNDHIKRKISRQSKIDIPE